MVYYFNKAKFKPINKILYEDIENCWGKEQLNYEIETGSKEKGAMRLEGKEYIVNDGDVMYFRFNV